MHRSTKHYGSDKLLMQLLQFILGLKTDVRPEETSPSHVVSEEVKMFNNQKVNLDPQASKRTIKNCPNMTMKA